MNDRVTLSVADQIADVRLARPDKMNALDPAMFDAIGATIDALAERKDVRCVVLRSEEHTSELQSLMRISYAVFCLKKKKRNSRNKYLSTTQNITPRKYN